MLLLPQTLDCPGFRRGSQHPPTRRIKATLVALLLVTLAACDREANTTESIPVKKSTPRAHSAPPESPLTVSAIKQLRQLESLSPARQNAVLEEEIYNVEDSDLPLIAETICTHPDPDLKSTLLVTLYEETQLRPESTRLPLLLEIARQSELPVSLRTTIMAELGTTLNAEHGASWSDWALALNEHLVETSGLIRVD